MRQKFINIIIIIMLSLYVFAVPMASTSKSKGKRKAKSQVPSVANLKWCKAMWYKKGSSGAMECEAIPRSWVSRSQDVVRWPPSHMNYKSAILACMLCPSEPDTWTKYQLVSATSSVGTLAEAEQLETEIEDVENSSDDAECATGKKGAAISGKPLGRGHRAKSKSSQLAGYESHVGDTTPAEDVESDAPRKEVRPTRVVEGDLGDTTGSAAILQKVGEQLRSAGTEQSSERQTAVATLAMKKAMPTYQYAYQTTVRSGSGS